MKSSKDNNTDKSTIELVRESYKNAVSYEDYRVLVKSLSDEGKSTGPKQTEALTNYTVLNDRRMKRLDKTVKVGEEYTEKIKSLNKKITFLVLTR